jgi:asparagine synthase (glutamine-hydrolysing)
MPGIVGIITKMPRAWAELRLRRMTNALCHESFYISGTWIDEALGVYVGWVSRRGSFSEGMPLCNEQEDVTLIFSGDEYPEPGISDRLKQRGHSLDMVGPSYLVHMYEEEPTFPKCLNGIFHGIVIDRARGTAMLFNDRYGMHHVYYHESDKAFYFAAEAKAILGVCPELRLADPRGLGEFVSFSCVLENRTIFKGIHVLPPGSAWAFRKSAIERKGAYFRPKEWEEQPPLGPEPYYRQLLDVLSKNVPRYFDGHERVGMTLTGGFDTRVIMAMRKPIAGSLPCYTFGGMFRECQDVRIAKEVANICRQSHEVITVGNDFLAHFPQYAERAIYLTEGGIDVSRCSDLYVSEKARSIAPAKVVGTYGSEILRGSVMFKPVSPPAGLYSPELLSYVNQAGETYAHVRLEHPVTFAAFRQSPWYHRGVLWLEESQLTVRSPFLDNNFVQTVYRAPKSDDLSRDVRQRLIQDGNPALGQIRTDGGVGGNSSQLASSVTRFFLSFLSKAEYAYDYGMPQWVAHIDHLFAALHMERMFLGRNKLLHFRLWYRDLLSLYVNQILLDPLTLSRPYIEKKGLETIVRSHSKGSRNYTREIHKLLSLELLHRLFLDPR